MVYYYNKKFPILDEIVIAKVVAINVYGVEVCLKEYNDIKGYINYSEVSRKKKFNVNKILAIDKEILLIVIAVDINKGYIDLSKRSISDEEIKLFNEKNKKYMQLYNLFKYIYFKLQKIIKIEDINQQQFYEFLENTLWNIQLTFDINLIFENIFEINNYDKILEKILFSKINSNCEIFKTILNQYILSKINKTNNTLVKSIKLLSYNINGIDDIKYVLNSKFYSEIFPNYNIQINYLTNSNYNISITQKNDIHNLNIEDDYIIIFNEIKKRAFDKKIIM
jgi:translation initiation factor 2 alpha subunit (eIF-2alpha)